MGNICNNTKPAAEDSPIMLTEETKYGVDYMEKRTARFSTTPSYFSNDDGERICTRESMRETWEDDCPETTDFGLLLSPTPT